MYLLPTKSDAYLAHFLMHKTFIFHVTYDYKNVLHFLCLLMNTNAYLAHFNSKKCDLSKRIASLLYPNKN